MSELTKDYISPLRLKISFNKLLEQYEQLVDSTDEIVAENARKMLAISEEYPELRDGFEELEKLETYKPQIAQLLRDTFSPVLTNNEIKAATIPFHKTIFNSSNRFKKIVEEAGEDFDLEITNMSDDQFYIMGCVVALQMCYGYNLDFRRPFYFEIPDKNGITKYYRILYNADFMEVKPNEKALPITQNDVDELMDNFENVDLWKEKFPVNSYDSSGFIIANMFDATADVSISNIKSTLIKADKRQSESFMTDFYRVFQSFFNIPDLQVGFSVFNKEEQTFERVYGKGIKSYLLFDKDQTSCNDILCKGSYQALISDKTYFAISDVGKYYEMSKGQDPYKSLYENGIKSVIFAPIVYEDELLGIIELVSKQVRMLNSVVANKLEDIMPFIVSSVQRSKNEEENQIEAIIQRECTSIHPSVYWRFEKEAKNFIKSEYKGEKPVFSNISFDNVYPLYGQIDIKGSSDARNQATKLDLTEQLNAAKKVVNIAVQAEQLPIYDQLSYQIDRILHDLKNFFQVDSEQQISEFLHSEVHPLFKHLEKKSGDLYREVEAYYELLDDGLGLVYNHRKDYDNSVSMINQRMAELLDKKQESAQQMYPHYFERFKTDGVEHNMYIGESITKEESFNPLYLRNLRLWQLQVMCEMENEYYHMRSEFPMQLDVASMILVFSSPLSISFRMDEKQFDVDGTYNARYEVVKKRVDKAIIKGTTKRITEKGKITIVYAQKSDEIEYLDYVRFLQSKNYLDKRIEIVELEDLQGVTGLKAIRVDVLYGDEKSQKFYTYKDLMKELEA